MSGFIALHRDVFTHPLLKDGDRFRAWFWLVANAAWKTTRHDARGKTIEVHRGQICAGREYLAKEWGWSPSAVERFLTRLETEHMIERETGHGKSLITICNYDKYQDVSDEAGQKTGQSTGQKSDRNRTAKEQGNKGTNISSEDKSSSDSAGEGADDLFGNPEQGPKPAKRKKSDEPFVLPDWIPADAWDGFEEMRRRANDPMTDRARRLIVGKLTKLAEDGHPPGDVLDQSTMRCWSGVFPIRDERNGTGNRNFQANQSGPAGVSRTAAAASIAMDDIERVFAAAGAGAGGREGGPGRHGQGFGSSDGGTVLGPDYALPDAMRRVGDARAG